MLGSARTTLIAPPVCCPARMQPWSFLHKF